MESHKYRISEVSKILNIPVDTLRYYEKQGIVRPSINKSNGYRYYDEWDISCLIEYKYYRALEFSMKDIMDIQQIDNLIEFTEKMNNQQQYFHNRKLYYTYLEECNEKKNERISQIPKELGKISIRKMEAMDYFLIYNGNEYKTYEHSGDLLSRWWNTIPFFNRLIYISQQHLVEKSDYYETGFSISTNLAELLDISGYLSTSHLPECEAVCTIVTLSDKRNLSLKVLNPVFEYIKRNKLHVEDIYGNLLARVQSSTGYIEYIELFTPIL